MRKIKVGVIRKINPDDTIFIYDKFGKLINLHVSRILKIQEVV